VSTNKILKFALPIAFVILARPAGSQQQAQQMPSVTKCRENQKLYISKFNEATRLWLSSDKKGDWPLPKMEGLTSWSEEMNRCKKVDSQNKCIYDFTIGEINADKVIRFGYFLHKHNLVEQFRQEDAKGELQFR
jgi:hypothetical protein